MSLYILWQSTNLQPLWCKELDPPGRNRKGGGVQVHAFSNKMTYKNKNSLAILCYGAPDDVLYVASLSSDCFRRHEGRRVTCCTWENELWSRIAQGYGTMPSQPSHPRLWRTCMPDNKSKLVNKDFKKLRGVFKNTTYPPHDWQKCATVRNSTKIV